MSRHVGVIGLSFGDEGKGATVDHLATTGVYKNVIRFSGGAQAAHHVVHEPTGKVHRFSQFGSGTFRGLDTVLSEYMMVDPLRLVSEANALKNGFGINHPLDLVFIDERALVTTPYHCFANRAAEVKRGQDAHGSCGVGVGETMRMSLLFPDDAIRIGDLRDPKTLRAKLEILHDRYQSSEAISSIWNPSTESAFGRFANEVPSVDDLMTAYSGMDVLNVIDQTDMDWFLNHERCIFEGSQGVLLDEWYGFHPHTTWSTTTFENVDKLLAASGVESASTYRLGALRSYTTRHGAGPFPTECARGFPEPHNGPGVYQGAWREGVFDAVLHRYAIEVAGQVDGLAISHLDCQAESYANGYLIDGMEVSRLAVKPRGEKENLKYQATQGLALHKAQPLYEQFKTNRPFHIAELLDTPVAIVAYGPTSSDRKGNIS